MAGKYGYKTGLHCRDYICPSNADLREYFTREGWRLHKRDRRLYLLAERVLCGLGHSDLFYNELEFIPLSDISKFHTETVMFLAKRLALYIIAPQQYGHHPRNIISASLNYFTGRMFRFRMGHKLSKKPTRNVSKAKLGLLIDEVLDNVFIWEMAELYVKSHKWRVKHGYCEPL